MVAVKGRLSAIGEKRERSTKIKAEKDESRVAIPVSLPTKPSCVVHK
jgi:hypothetical protein